MPDNVGWSLIAHGGAKDIAPHEEIDERAGLQDAVRLGSQMLEEGASALETVEEVVRQLERCPVYNAGLYGSVVNEEGKIEMDASIMDGATLDIGAVAGIEDFEHPVSIARALLRDRAILLVGSGAAKFAYGQGFRPPENLAQIEANAPKQAVGCDTVGCVARDKKGMLAVATSTGGLKGSRKGRVGDVPLPGCGFYADNTKGAVSASGDGEYIARVMLAYEFLRRLETMDPNAASADALSLLSRVGGEAGLIGIAQDGAIGWNHVSPHFAVGLARQGDPGPHVYLKKNEEHVPPQ